MAQYCYLVSKITNVRYKSKDKVVTVLRKAPRHKPYPLLN